MDDHIRQMIFGHISLGVVRFFRPFQQQSVFLCQCLINVAHGFLTHAVKGWIGFDRLHPKGFQMAKPFHEILGNVSAVAPAGHPREASIAQLAFDQLFLSAAQFMAHFIEVKQQAHVLFLLGFALCLQDPRRFLNQSVLQVLIFEQIALQSLGLGRAPLFKDPLDFGVAVGDMAGQGIGVVARKDLLGTLIGIFHEVRQRLNGVPSGVLGEL